MLRITGLKLAPGEDAAVLKNRAARKLGIRAEEILSVKIYKKSLDARKKQTLHFLVTLDVAVRGDEEVLLRRAAKEGVTKAETYHYQLPPVYAAPPEPPVVVGAGPAGLFAALILAEAGWCPLLIERGRDVDRRTEEVAAFWERAVLCEESNVQFGEGGAGAFSDGKLTTGTKDPRIRKVLEEFVRCGAPEEILYLAKPHIGTDRLKPVIKALRQRILSLGGKVRFETRLEGLRLEKGRLCGLEVSVLKEGQTGRRTEEIASRRVILAIGHSARDTLEKLYAGGVAMAQKPFSLGVRIEHRQRDIDRAQYGSFAGHHDLGAADYRLSAHLPNGRGVYTFCMCPGGVVVGASSEPDMVVTNGMSEHARAGKNANSALLVGVSPEDFPGGQVLAGIEWQRELERAAFSLGGGGYRAPVQLLGDFLQDTPSRTLGEVEPTYRPGYTLTNLSALLPEFAVQALREGARAMERRLPGFLAADAVLTGPETRSSSPVRLLRGGNREAAGIRGLYPCGEGAGYAGGIVSAAVDGIRAAEAILEAEFGEV